MVLVTNPISGKQYNAYHNNASNPIFKILEKKNFAYNNAKIMSRRTRPIAFSQTYMVCNTSLGEYSG
jgi:hypothetical protein